MSQSDAKVLNSESRIGIVNRGEAAVRFIRALKEYNGTHGTSMTSVALFIENEREAVFARAADESFNLTPHLTAESGMAYLNRELMIFALKATECDAVWVGWGFLSEDTDFASMIEKESIVFLGPTSASMALLGDKIAAKELAEDADVPILPWSRGSVKDVKAAKEISKKLGYPVIVKASNAGGGRGIRFVMNENELESQFLSAKEETVRITGNDVVFIELLVEKGRHLEVQGLCDSHGNVMTFGVRDCSVQRRNQKIIEETPPPCLDESIVKEVEKAAARLLSRAGYRSAGTVEFLYDLNREAFYFMEVNTRLQVEHPITEQLYGIDLVKGQIQVACGDVLDGPIPLPRGSAIELRLNVEDPDRDFTPAPGFVSIYKIPAGPGIRVDSGIREGSTIPQEFDSMVAKVIAYGSDRMQSLGRLERALQELKIKIDNGTTNRAFLMGLIRSPEVRAGGVHTKWVEELLASDRQLIVRDKWEAALSAAAIEQYLDMFAEDYTNFRYQLTSTGHPRNTPKPKGYEIALSCSGISYTLEVMRIGNDLYQLGLNDNYAMARYRKGTDDSVLEFEGTGYSVQTVRRGDALQVEIDEVPYSIEMESGGSVKAPSPAVVLNVNVAAGQRVEKGDLLLSLEAMKMEMIVNAPQAGVVRGLAVTVGEQVAAGQALVHLEAEDNDGAEEIASGDPIVFSGNGRDELDSQWLRIDSCLSGLYLGYDFSEDEADIVTEMLSFVEAHAEYRERFEESCLFALECFVSLEQLFSSERLPAEGFARHVSWMELLFHYFRRDVDREKGMPVEFLDGLDSALSCYYRAGAMIDGSNEEIIFHIYCSHSVLSKKQDLVRSVLFAMETLGAVPGNANDLVTLLDGIVRLTGEQTPAVADMAVHARHHLIDRMYLEQLKDEWSARVDTLLDETIEMEHVNPDRDEKIEEIVDAGTHVLSLLVKSADAPATPKALLSLDLLGRIYSRDRSIDSVANLDHEGFQYSVAYSKGTNDINYVTVLAVAKASDIQLRIGHMGVLAAEKRDASFHEIIILTQSPSSAVPESLDLESIDNADLCCVGFLEREGNRSYRTYLKVENGFNEDPSRRLINPLSYRELKVHRLKNFNIEPLYNSESVLVLKGTAKGNVRDERLFALVTTTETDPEMSDDQSVTRIVEFEHAFMEAVYALREIQAKRKYRLQWNRIIVHNRSLLRMNLRQIKEYGLRLLPRTEDLGIEKMVVYSRRKRWREDVIREIELVFLNISEDQFTLRSRTPSEHALAPMDGYVSNVVRARQRGNVYPYELLKMLTLSGLPADRQIPRGEFEEFDVVVDENGDQRVVSVKGRNPGQNEGNIVFGLITSYDKLYPEGFRRVLVLSDTTTDLGTLAEPECRRLIGALDYAEAKKIPVEWVPVSSGAKIDMESGTENLDWTASALRRIIEFTQNGGEINIIVSGINVGAQSYWNAESTMLMHTRGLLIMTDEASMLLTGKKALDFSGSVSAEDNIGIGGVEKIMGPNGESQIWAKNLTSAFEMLFQHYRYAYVMPGAAFPIRASTEDPLDRDVSDSIYQDNLGQGFKTIGDIFSKEFNPERKKPFDMRQVMKALVDQDNGHFERWENMQDAETAIIWETRIGGYSTGLIGIESKALTRFGEVPHDGPESWSGGTLFPLSSKKVARGINAFSGKLPLVILANLSGFDGSPESLRRLQLEYGAEIGRAIVNFKGPVIFVVVARYHGGAYVVFSKTLNPLLKSAALGGSYASVIGGAPAAAVVFPRAVVKETLADERVMKAQSSLKSDDAFTQLEYDEIYQKVYSEKQTALGQRFDKIHSVERAQEVGSIDDIIKTSELRPYVINSVEEGMQKYRATLD